MKVNFYLRPAKNEHSIYCFIREAKQTLRIHTGERIKEEFWDKSRQRADVRKTRNNIIKKNLRDINQFLDSYENEIWKIRREIKRKNFDANFEKVADTIKKHFTKEKLGFFDIYELFLKVKRPDVTKASIQKLERVKALLKEFEIEYKQKLDFDNITPLFFSQFYSFLIGKKKMINNTATKNIGFFKSFLIWANNNNFTDNTSYKSFKGKSEQTEVIYLTEDELMTLYNLDLNEERLQRVRDIFCFQCFTGVRYSDIENISRDDIKGSTWRIRVQKTHQLLEIPLNQFAISILAKYNEYPKPLPTISNQKMNKYLKELCKIAKIDEPVKLVRYKGKQREEKLYKKYEVIGTHTARRTFISLSLQKGMKPDVIMAITGHSTYRMMQRYLKIADEHKREEMDKVWGSSLRIVK